MAQFDPTIHHRRSVRLAHHDYSDAGWYAVTFCTHDRACILGECLDSVVVLSRFGQAVDSVLRRYCDAGPIGLSKYVVMPNHLHCIVVIAEPRHAGVRPTTTSRAPGRGSLGATVGAIKACTAKTINAMRGSPGSPVWQRSYWDRVLRDEQEVLRFQEYVAMNPARWSNDKYNA
jgi:REP element-mobilizing transposase RayT